MTGMFKQKSLPPASFCQLFYWTTVFCGPDEKTACENAPQSTISRLVNTQHGYDFSELAYWQLTSMTDL
jgi:hypothetical protein